MATVCVDGTFFEVDENGQLTFKRESVGLRTMLVYAAPGVAAFEKANYPGLQRVRVRVVGGGGGGAGALASSGEAVVRAGASGGAYSESLLDAAALGASESVIVGVGGAGGVNNDSGNDGGQSSFGGFVSAPGGRGSVTTMSSGTTIGTASGTNSPGLGVGQIRANGAPGTGPFRFNSTATMTGTGGNAGGGLGQGGPPRTFASDGTAGTGYGGGGGGATSIGDPQNGGRGADGVVILELFF